MSASAFRCSSWEKEGGSHQHEHAVDGLPINGQIVKRLFQSSLRTQGLFLLAPSRMWD